MATNQIRASCIGNELSLAVNGIPLINVTDSAFATGDVGLGVSTLAAGNGRCRVRQHPCHGAVTMGRGLLRLRLAAAAVVLAAACSQAQPSVILTLSGAVSADPNDNWLLEGDAVGRSLILNEQLVIQIDAPNTMQYATLNEPTFSDFVLEVDARLLSGPEESSYGIIFRQDEDGRFYRFQITGTGFYVLERRNGDGSWTRLTDGWTESEAIYQGLNIGQPAARGGGRFPAGRLRQWRTAARNQRRRLQRRHHCPRRRHVWPCRCPGGL
jgi:hypothetical protein